jgi:hypothetical protein
MAIIAISVVRIIVIESSKVLHFHEVGNDKQQEVLIFIGNFVESYEKEQAGNKQQEHPGRDPEQPAYMQAGHGG